MMPEPVDSPSSAARRDSTEAAGEPKWERHITWLRNLSPAEERA
jgi:hypothetical protein